MPFLRKILSYLNIFSKENKTTNINLKMMHGINRISIFLFLFAAILMLIRYFSRH